MCTGDVVNKLKKFEGCGHSRYMKRRIQYWQEAKYRIQP